MFPLRLKLFPRFLILLILLSVIPVALVGRLVLNINNESLQFEVQRYHLHLAQSLAEKFDDRVTNIVSQLVVPIHSVSNPTIGWEERQKILGALIDSTPHFAILSVVTGSGAEVIKAYNPQLAPEVDANPALVSHNELPLFSNFKETGNQVVSVSKQETNTFAEIYIPFDSPGGKNAFYVKLALTDLCEMVNHEVIGQTGYATLVGKDGTVFGRKSTEDASIVQTALTGSQGAREFSDSKGKQWVGASAPLAKLGGAIITQQPRNEAYAASIKGETQAFVVTGLTILFALIAAIFLTRSLVRPLIKISTTVAQVDLASGIFPNPIRINSRDEIEDMATTFNSMIEKLKGYASLQVEKLIIEQKKTEAIIFSIQDGIVMTDYQGKVQLISHRAKSILKIRENESILGQPLWRYLPSPEIKTACMELLTNPENKKMIEVKMPSGDDKVNYYNMTAEQVRTPNKEEALGVVTVLHDITLEKQLDMMKEEFLHSITHDLRNPLTAIRGFIRLFQSGQTGAVSAIQAKMLDTMDNASLRLVNMVNDILDLARLESNRLQLHIDEARMDEIISRVVDLFQPQARTNGIALKMEVEGETNPINVDPNLMERVFTNLVSNATKFTPEGGTITVRLQNMADSIRCSVNDTGEGIPPSYLQKVFDKFQQVEGHFKGGAGLGLTICKRIVEAHEGKIWVESEVGKGASFIFVIPRTQVVEKKTEKAA